MAVSANQTITYDGRLTFAINLWLKTVMNDVFLGHNPFFAKMKEKGNIKTGGLAEQLLQPIMIPQAGGPVVRGITDAYGEPVEYVPMQGMTSAYYTPAEYIAPLSVKKREMKLLTGAAVKKVDYVQNCTKKMLKQFFSQLNADFWALEGATGAAGDASHLASIRCFLNRGGTSTTATVAPLPLTEQLYNSGTAPGGSAVGTTPVTLVGGIQRNAAENGYWCTPVVTGATDTPITLLLLNNLISLATRNEDTPDFGVMFRQGFDKIVTQLMGAGFTNLWETSDTMKKFSGFKYRGVDWVFDDQVPLSVNGAAGSGQAFILNSEYTYLECDTLEPEVERKQDPTRALLLWMLTWYGQLTSGHLGRVNVRHAALSA